MNIDCCKSYVGKQIIGLAPVPPTGPTCLYYIILDDASYGQFTDPSWDFGGFGTDFTSYINSIGGYVVQDGDYTIGSFDTNNSLRFYYLGTSQPPDLVVYNPNIANYQSLSYIPACLNGCLALPSYRYNNSPYGWIAIGNMIPYANLLNYGGFLDFNAGAFAVESILTFMLSKYQPQARVFVVDDGGGFFTITFQNFYYDQSILPPNTSALIYNNNINIEFHTAAPC